MEKPPTKEKPIKYEEVIHQPKMLTQKKNVIPYESPLVGIIILKIALVGFYISRLLAFYPDAFKKKGPPKIPKTLTIGNLEKVVKEFNIPPSTPKKPHSMYYIGGALDQFYTYPKESALSAYNIPRHTLPVKKNKTVSIFYAGGLKKEDFYFHKYIEEIVNIKYTETNPDYVIAYPQGKTNYHPRFRASIKLFYTDSMIPDFEDCDYAISYSPMQFLDRFLIYPRFLMKPSINLVPKTREYDPNRKFCGGISGHIENLPVKFPGRLPKFKDFRAPLIAKLNKYKNVEMGTGNYKDKDNYKERIKYLSNYRFVLAFEAMSEPGYATEVLFDAFAAGAIPIYFGDDFIFEIVNPKSMIFIRNETQIDDVVKLVTMIDQNEALYKKMLSEPILLDYDLVKKEESRARDFIYHIFEQTMKVGRRREKMYDYAWAKDVM